jgi:hypothetical protein
MRSAFTRARWRGLAFGLLSALALCGATPDAPRAGPRPTRAVDLFVVSEPSFVPGSQAAIRVSARAVASLTESRPLAGAGITVALAGKGKTVQLFSGKSDGSGTAEASFRLPSWPDGSYQMTVKLHASAGEKTVERQVELKRGGRVLLVTDKPIYQPRQLIHMRALCLSAHDLKPIAQELIRFEVQDAKGNKVFRKEIRSNAFGITATSFQLADEINMGNYQIEAAPVRQELAERAAKTVVVKKYVLPKFKVALESDRPYYLPKQTVKGKLRSDYFFGKPVSGGKVVVEASTFDGVSFKKFSTQKGQTDKDGSFSFELALPDYFVGQPLLKGDALVKLEAKVTDTANHNETGTRSVPVAAAPIRVAAISESGRLVPGIENQVYLAASYPDGSPARASLEISAGGKKLGRLQTDEVGLAVLRLTPREKELAPAQWRQVTEQGQTRWVQARALTLSVEAKDAKGASATVQKTLTAEPGADQLLLRTDKAIYKAGETLEANVLAQGGGTDTVYLDLVKNRQTLLTRMLILRGGRGSYRLPFGLDTFGSLELHAYRIQTDGEIVRDARVVYVQPPRELAIEVSPDKQVYRPGGHATIRFRVTDTEGRPQQSALGLVIVDEAVYALQEIQPGLEKVFFTLEKELAKPRYQIEFAPQDNLEAMIKTRELQAQRQRVAKVLLAGAQPAAAPKLWQNPVAERMQRAQQSQYSFQSAIQQAVYQGKPGFFQRGADGKWRYPPNLIAKLVAAKLLPAEHAKDPLGQPYTPAGIEALWPQLSAQRLIGQQELNRLWNLRYQVQSELGRRTRSYTRLGGKSLETHLALAFQTVVKNNTGYGKDPLGKPYRWANVSRLPGYRVSDFVADLHNGRVNSVWYGLYRLAQQPQGPARLDRKRNAWVLPGNAVAIALRQRLLQASYAKDLWGRVFVLRPRGKPQASYVYDQRLRYYDLVSAGADGQVGTGDDLVYPRTQTQNNPYQLLAKALGVETGGGGLGWGRHRFARERERRFAPMKMARGAAAEAAPAAMDDLLDGAIAGGARTTTATPKATAGSTAQQGQAGAPQTRQVRVREYFPETLLFQPSLITDEKGEAKLDLTMADSITTWRMTASASSTSGSLGAQSSALRVFQDFFVDLDLPVSLTQNDEVSVPIVVYNYLKKPQRVRLELKAASWFELKGGRVQEIALQPAEVRATYYRLRVKELGRRRLEVRADGSSMSDAIRREIEILPDGQEQNLVANGRLEGTITKSVPIPGDAVPGASKILVRLYPGVFSQVMEGMESMLRLPGG